jgi:hypothetical protein
VWVNGEPIPESPRADGARLQTQGAKAGAVSVPIGEGGQRYELRVGETLDRSSGEVRDLVGGEIRVRPGGGSARSGGK